MSFEDKLEVERKIVEASDDYDMADHTKRAWMASKVPEAADWTVMTPEQVKRRIRQAKRLVERAKESPFV